LHIIGSGKGSAERRTAAKFNQCHARGVNRPTLLSVIDKRFGNEGEEVSHLARSPEHVLGKDAVTATDGL